ncbi:hypothetical protein E2C01_084617 [Portunus trituberculatus]|uniref:Uncharacterized protein n=1 Tax=Portunus trituberculatus TaxID=210409 RepID=A0A5B7J5B7_PORTR|nr:hypothetical protein [Portunus trituberculatus]
MPACLPACLPACTCNLLTCSIVESRKRENQSVLSDEEAQEVVLLLSPTDKTAPNLPHPQETAPPPVPPHYTKPGQGDEYDSSLTPHFDPSLTSPLSPEEEPSEHDSSEGSGVGSEAFQVTRVKEVSFKGWRGLGGVVGRSGGFEGSV